ncbi:hypothetical protein MAPG_00968 [Magnaporthiopsis poae ATCC 64411]|uniref:Uncharacterized protein n=1 Tax=Magnaporthiopsis poae (strain ATCC 64411 / 73-15) TaxID=644358 RepID=A0A0C4DMG1_MAGP6|nr:hypothetical protein MAPG_00968 [Magnaporthiopsis poae ATCC 64411]
MVCVGWIGCIIIFFFFYFLFVILFFSPRPRVGGGFLSRFRVSLADPALSRVESDRCQGLPTSQPALGEEARPCISINRDVILRGCAQFPPHAKPKQSKPSFIRPARTKRAHTRGKTSANHGARSVVFIFRKSAAPSPGPPLS